MCGSRQLQFHCPRGRQPTELGGCQLKLTRSWHATRTCHGDRGARGSRSRAASVTGCGAASRAASTRLTNSCLSPSEERPQAVSSWRRRATVRLRTSATERFLRPQGIVRNGRRGKRRLHEGQAKAEEKRKLFGYQLSKGGKSSSKNSGDVDGREAPLLFVRCYGNA